jgi:hypothetical protein
VPDASIGCLLGCGRPAHRRGLCPRHYCEACKRVRRGETTWAALERASHALPVRDKRPLWNRR